MGSHLKMFALTTLLLLFISQVFSVNLVHLSNGNYFINGKGCGISTPIKYLYHIPRNLSDQECVIIQKPTGFAPKNATKKEISNDNSRIDEVCEFPAQCEELKFDGFCDDPCNNSACG